MSETRNPLWDRVLLVTVTHPRTLTEEVAKRMEQSLERVLRPLTDAKILILEEGATLHLHGGGEALSMSSNELRKHLGLPQLDEKGMQIWEEHK